MTATYETFRQVEPPSRAARTADRWALSAAFPVWLIVLSYRLPGRAGSPGQLA